MSSPLAVLGGSFDPVHRGHVAAANFALDFLQAERVKMIPCHVPNHKAMLDAEAAHRMAMLEIATAHFPRIEVDPIELRSDRVSYTVDTLAELRRGQETLVFVMGVDSFNSLPQWHDWRRIFDLTHLLVLSRPGSTFSEATLSLAGKEARLVETLKELLARPNGSVIHCPDFHYDVESSEIRTRLLRGDDVSAELDEGVVQYIRDKGLYRNKAN